MGIADRYLQTLENQTVSEKKGITPKLKSVQTQPLKSTTPHVSTATPHVSTPKPTPHMSPSKISSTRDIPKITKSNSILMQKPDRNPLMHNQDLTASQISWDKERKNWQTYEYLCHVVEAKEWMEKILETDLGPAEDFPPSLQNGVLLAKIVQKLRPDLMKWPIFEHKRLQYRHTENITQFFKFLEDLKIPELFLFDMTDLYERRNLPKVIYCIHAVSHFIADSAQHFAAVDDLVGKLQFSEQQLTTTDQQIAGRSMPNFNAMNRKLSGVRNLSLFKDFDDLKPPVFADDDLVMPPKLENLDINQLSDEEQDSELPLNVKPRRSRQSAAQTSQKHNSRTVTPLSRTVTPTYLYNNRFSQYDSRRRQTSNYRNLSSFTSLRNKVMNSVEQMFAELESLEPEIAVFEGICRGFLTRRKLAKVIEKNKANEQTVQLISIFKGNQLRAKLEDLHQQVHSTDISSLQSLIRGSKIRNKFNNSVNDAHGIKNLQAIVSGKLLRKKLASTKLQLESKEVLKSTVGLQSAFRGVVLRFKIGCLYDDIDREIQGVIQLQAVIRRRPHSQNLRTVQQTWTNHTQDIINIQSIWRAHKQGTQYRNFLASTKPTLDTIRPFLHLLVDNSEDYTREVELENVVKQISQFAKRNEDIETKISNLDTKMALLVKNDLSVDELVLKQQKQDRAIVHDLERERSFGNLPGIPKSTSKARLSQIAGNGNGNFFDLNSLQKSSRDRVELYQCLLYVLQTRREYTKKLMSCNPISKSKENATLVLSIFAGAQNKRESFFLLQLLAECITESEVGSEENLTAWRVVSTLNKTHESVESMKLILKSPMQTLKTMSDQLLEYDPHLIYEHISGGSDLPSEEAIQNPKVRALFVKNMMGLREIAQLIIKSLIANLTLLPYHIKYLSFAAYDHVYNLTSNLDLAHSAAVQVIISQFLQPAMLNADDLELIDSAIGYGKKNISLVSRVVHQVALMTSFPKGGTVDAFLQPLNDFIKDISSQFSKKFDELKLTTPDLRAHYKVSEADDLVSCEKVHMFIKIDDLLYIHQMCYQQLNQLTFENDKCLRPLMESIGPMPKDLRELQDLLQFKEIKLDLNPKFCTSDLESNNGMSLIAITKRCLGYLLRVQNESTDLLSILIKPVDFKDEHKYNLLLDTENLREAAGELGNLTFRELKLLTLEKILELESNGTISREDGYQRLINEIADDIRNKDTVRRRKVDTLKTKKQMLVSIKEKNDILEKRLEIFGRNIDDALASLQATVHQQNLQKSKRFQKFQLTNKGSLEKSDHPKYGQYKYNAEKLFERGILVRLRGYQERQFKDVVFVFSCFKVGKFVLEVFYKNILLPNGRIQFSIDDLLGFQYQGAQYIHYLDDQIQFNTNRLLKLVLHKYFGTTS